LHTDNILEQIGKTSRLIELEHPKVNKLTLGHQFSFFIPQM